MSVPELPHILSDLPLDFLRNTTKLIDELCSELKKLHEKNQFIYNYMVDHLQYFKHSSQPQTVPDPFQGITLIFKQTIYDQDQTMYNYMVEQLQNSKLKMQPQAIPFSDLSLSKVTSQKIFVSAYLYPDLDPFQAISRVFIKTSNRDPHTSCL